MFQRKRIAKGWQRRSMAALCVGLWALSSVAPARAQNANGVSLVTHQAGAPGTSASGGDNITFANINALSANGRYAVYVSDKTNLVAGQSDDNEGADVFLYDRTTTTSVLVSHTAGSLTTTSSGGAGTPVISADGRFVAFASGATDLVDGIENLGGHTNIFLYQVSSGQITLISHSAAAMNVAADSDAIKPAINADGSVIAFSSEAGNLVAGQTSAFFSQVFVAQNGKVSLVSHDVSSPTAPANFNAGNFGNLVISADGKSIAYNSTATNLVPAGVRNKFNDVFLFRNGINTLVSHATSGLNNEAAGESTNAVISADGNVVAYEGGASNLVADYQDSDPSTSTQIYAFKNGVNTLVSHVPGAVATAAGGFARNAVINRDGSSIAFNSTGKNLVSGQTNTNPDSRLSNVFLSKNGQIVLISHASGSANTVGDFSSETGGISADGRLVIFTSAADNLVSGMVASSNLSNVFLSDGDTNTLISRAPNAQVGSNGLSNAEEISGDGSAVLFQSDASNLISGGTSPVTNLYLFTNAAAPAAPALSINNAAPVKEGNSGQANSAQFTITLSAAVTSEVRVNYGTADGTAKAGQDYVATTGTLVFAAGQTSKTVSVPILGDTVAEGNETFTLVLSNATNATLGATTSATATILDDDAPSLSLSIVPAGFNEGAGSSAAMATLSRSGPIGAALTVSLKSSNPARVTVPATVVIPANQSEVKFPVSAVDNTVMDGQVDVTITASAEGLTTATAKVTVSDNDTPPANQVPVAQNQTLRTNVNTPVSITLSATNTKPDTYFRIVSAPKNGTLADGSGTSLIYTPKAGFVGTDSFTFVANNNDGTVDSNLATITLQVLADTPPANTPPVAVAQNLSTTPNTPLRITLRGTDSDVPAQTLAFRIVTQPQNGTLSGTGANLTYTPRNGFTGTDSFTFVTNDGTSDSAPARIGIRIASGPHTAARGRTGRQSR